MAFTPEFRQKAEALLSSAVSIQSKLMFGGIAIYSGGLLFAIVDDDRLYFKVDDASKGDFEAAGMGPFVPYEGSKPMSYYEAPASAWKGGDELGKWVDLAMGAAERMALKKAKKK